MTLRGTDGGRGATQEGSMGVQVALTSGDLRRTYKFESFSKAQKCAFFFRCFLFQIVQ